jgi:dihydrofolate reductase
MRKVIWDMSVSLDGFMEGPDHDLSWHLITEEWHTYVNGTLRPLSAFLHGRVVWDLMVDYWPTADQDPDSPEPIKEFAAIWRDKQKIVYSRTLPQTELPWNTTVVRDVVPAEVNALKEQPGGDMAVGGTQLASEFLRHDLIDEFWIYVHPVIVGNGTRMFEPTGSQLALELLETRTFGNGVVLLRHARAR